MTTLAPVRVSIAVENPLTWLAAQKIYPKVYWKSRDDKKTIAAVGIAAQFETPRAPCFAAFRFEGGGTFFQPKAVLTEEAGEVSLELFLPSDDPDEVEKALAHLCFIEEPLPILPKPLHRLDMPTKPLWKEAVEEALETEEIEKVVLARKTTLTFDAPIEPLSLLAGKKSCATLFCFEEKKGTAFLGASPELFYRREGRQITTEALAGTRCPGELFGDKERREWDAVRLFIEKCLSPLCETWEMDPVQTVRAGSVEHLRAPFRGVLREGVSDADLVSALHPTPAMGGVPQEKAVAFIGEIEPFDRGYYAAPIGWIGEERTELFVAIRSALVEGASIDLFAGAGIVEGSTAEGEWQEIEDKVGSFLC